MKKELKALFKAIRKNPDKALKKLMKMPGLAHLEWDGSDKWIKGSTPLHWASHEGDLNLVMKLVELGVDVNAENGDWWCRPVDWAADAGRFKIVKYLIENGADIGGDKWSNCTPLHVAAQGGSSSGSKRKKGYKKVTEILIEASVNINEIARYGGHPPPMTPLDDAIQAGNRVVEKILLKNNALRAQQLEEK